MYVYDGSGTPGGWRAVSSFYVYDGSHSTTGWRAVSTGWVYDGTTWRNFWTGCSNDVTCDSGAIAWTEAGCTDANECQYCIGVNTTNCEDACHNIDGFVSTNGGSFLGSLPCRNEGCTQQTGTDCNAEMDCNLNSGGTRCYSTSDDIQGRLTVEADSDGTDNCSYTGATKTGSCVA
jgi:hypothetical protein